MEKNTIIALVTGLVIGTGITFGVMTYTKDNTQNKAANDHSSMSMDDMNKELINLSGDDFDKAFVEMMIAHHEGAVDMAELSASRAKHDEIKQLSKNIISAQEKEISEMKQWQTDWGYKANESGEVMHGGH